MLFYTYLLTSFYFSLCNVALWNFGEVSKFLKFQMPAVFIYIPPFCLLIDLLSFPFLSPDLILTCPPLPSFHFSIPSLLYSLFLSPHSTDGLWVGDRSKQHEQHIPPYSSLDHSSTSRSSAGTYYHLSVRTGCKSLWVLGQLCGSHRQVRSKVTVTLNSTYLLLSALLSVLH